MLKNYLLVGIRNLKRQFLYSFINVIGLSVGICCVSLILLYVGHELTYDKHHPDYKKIYRLDFSGTINDSEFITCLMSAPAATVLVQDFPEELMSSFRFRQSGDYYIKKEGSDLNFKEENVLFADSNLLSFWNIPVLYGNPKEALNKPKTLVISQKISQKLFGNVNPVGETVILDNKNPWTVGAVIQNIPNNSHFGGDVFLTMLSRDEAHRPIWFSFNFHTYYKVKEGLDIKSFENELNQYIPEKYLGPEIVRFMNMDLEAFRKEGNRLGFSFMPLSDIHLKSNKLGELTANGDVKYVYIFSAIGLFILLLASVNFINLSTARSIKRAKEVGLRKVLGGHRATIITQFLAEAFLITLMAAFLSYIILFLIRGAFNEISNKTFGVGDLFSPVFLAYLFGLTLTVAFISGIYPAFYLSRYQLVKTLKGKLNTENKGLNLRNALVVFQFAVSLIMIVGTITVNSQLRYIQDKKLGYDKERVLLIEDAWILRENVDAFKNEVLKSSKIENATVTGFFPVDFNHNNNVYWPGKSEKPESNHVVNNHTVDYNYISTLGIGISEGRNFSEDFPSDSMSILINESCARQMGLENPIGSYISTYSSINEETVTASFKVIGVVKDFHYRSFREPIAPVVLHLGESPFMVGLKVNRNADVRATIAEIESIWDQIAPGQPFEYSFLDEHFDRLHEAEGQVSVIINIFTAVAMFIACLGLFGLSSFTASQKIKEIGIRKVLGASNLEIIGMLSLQFLKPVLISLLIAFPIAWYAMERWLEDFAYRIDLDWILFFASGAAAIVLAWITMSYHSIVAANTNPTETLNYE